MLKYRPDLKKRVRQIQNLLKPLLTSFKLIVLRAQEELNAHIWSDWQSIDEFDGSDKKSSKKQCQSRKNDQFEVKLLFESSGRSKKFPCESNPTKSSELNFRTKN